MTNTVLEKVLKEHGHSMEFLESAGWLDQFEEDAKITSEEKAAQRKEDEDEEYSAIEEKNVWGKGEGGKSRSRMLREVAESHSLPRTRSEASQGQ